MKKADKTKMEALNKKDRAIIEATATLEVIKETGTVGNKAIAGLTLQKMKTLLEK